MIWRLLGVYLLCSTCTTLAQDYVQPDVSFTDTNSRFDLTEMMGAQDKANRDIPLADEDDDEDFRRQGVKKTLTRRAEGDFAYHDRMDSREGGTMSDFEENLKHFQRIKDPSRRFKDYDDHSQYKRLRRSADDDTEGQVLMNNVVPFIFKVDGYLKPPL